MSRKEIDINLFDQEKSIDILYHYVTLTKTSDKAETRSGALFGECRKQGK